MKKILNKLFDILFPPRCCGCKKMISSSKQFLCDTCRKTITKIHFQCRTCGKPLNITKEQCYECRGIQRAYNKLYLAFYYEEALRKLIHAFKYKGRKDISIYCSELLSTHNQCMNYLSSGQWDYIVPVPIHKKRMKKRGYNQAGLLAENIKHICSIPVISDRLIKCKNTKSLHGLSKKDRKKELKEAFNIRDPIIFRNKKILLVDDIVTTGTTMDICAKILKQQGNASIIHGFAFSHK